jgi:uncharacterized membrane protein YoaK (UPF0700 family)
VLSSLRKTRPWVWFLIVGGMLPLVGGYVDGLGLGALGFFTSHMTGNTARLGDSIAHGQWQQVRLFFSGLVAFCLGAAVSAVLSELSQRFSRGRYSAAFGLEAATLTGAALALLPRLGLPPSLPVAMLCFAMGLQNGVTSRISGVVLRTTHLTGVLTDLGLMIGRRLIRVERASDQPGSGAMHAAIFGAFLAGVILGVWGGTRFGAWAVLIPAAVVLALAFVDGFSLLEPKAASTVGEVS